MTPRPNCAGRPVNDRVVRRSTWVRLGASAVAVAVTSIAAVEVDPPAFPVASIFARWAVSSFSTIRAWPLYVIRIGPSLILTEPLNSSPSTWSRIAPGKHGPTCSMSSRLAHAFSTPTGTSNRCSSSMPTSWLSARTSGRGHPTRQGPIVCRDPAHRPGEGFAGIGGVLQRRARRPADRNAAGPDHRRPEGRTWARSNTGWFRATIEGTEPRPTGAIHPGRPVHIHRQRRRAQAAPRAPPVPISGDPGERTRTSEETCMASERAPSDVPAGLGADPDQPTAPVSQAFAGGAAGLRGRPTPSEVIAGLRATSHGEDLVQLMSPEGVF